MYVWEPHHIHERFRDGKGNRDVWHSELRMRWGTWGFREEEGHSQDNEKSSCSVSRCLPCPVDRSSKVIVGDNASMGKAPNLKFSKGEVRVSPESVGSRLPSAQNNSHAKCTSWDDLVWTSTVPSSETSWEVSHPRRWVDRLFHISLNSLS